MVCQGIEKIDEVGHRKLWTHPEPVPVSPTTSSDSLPCCESSAGMFPLQTNALILELLVWDTIYYANLRVNMGPSLTSIAL